VGDNKQILKDQKISHTNQLHKQNERDEHTAETCDCVNVRSV